MVDEVIQTFCRIGFPPKFGLSSLICKNFKTLTKVLMNHAKFTQI